MWRLMKRGQYCGNYSNYMELMIDDESDLTTKIPEEFGYPAPGSIAYTCEIGGLALDRLFMIGAYDESNPPETDSLPWVEM